MPPAARALHWFSQRVNGVFPYTALTAYAVSNKYGMRQYNHALNQSLYMIGWTMLGNLMELNRDWDRAL